MGTIQFWDSKILFVDGQIAMDPACCCYNPCNDCGGAPPETVTVTPSGFIYETFSPYNNTPYVLDYYTASGECFYRILLDAGVRYPTYWFYLYAKIFYGATELVDAIPEWKGELVSGKWWWSAWMALSFGEMLINDWNEGANAGAMGARSETKLDCDSSDTCDENVFDHIGTTVPGQHESGFSFDVSP